MNIHRGGEAPQRAVEITQPVAVIGIGCRFPGGVQDAESYWNFLLEKQCGIVEIPADRWNVDAFYDPEPDARGKMRTRWGGFLASDVYGFDPSFFDMSPREVTSMDPQQRLALQVAYETVQDSSHTLADLRGSRTGVFLGISTNDFGQNLRRGRVGHGDIFAGTGSAFSISANRISHRFDLRGPSLAIDTACSSALVAIDQAVRHLGTGTCEMALAGGVNCMLDPGPFIAFSSANMLSPTGGIYTFDERADGFVRGEGCGFVLLKPLDRAVADGDRIYGVIRHSMVNQDGYTPTLTSPSGEAQQAMLEALIAGASIDPADVDYVEAHGTGTPVGDPIEAAAIGRVFGTSSRAKPVYVGSFKPNLGHLESASGIAGFIKALLTASHGVVAPNRNFDRPNPNIPFDALNIAVASEPTRIDHPGRPALAVVNSFGFGGTNASVAVEGWTGPSAMARRDVKSVASGHPIAIPLSAGSPTGLQLWAERLADAMNDGGSLATTPVEDLAAHLGSARDNLAQRAALIVEPDRQAVQAQLRALAANTIEQSPTGPTILTGRAAHRRLAIAFSGQGGQWWAMARRLLNEDKAFRRSVETFDEVMKPLVGWSTVEEMLKDEKSTRINDADVTQASIFATQISLYDRWIRMGARPELLIGHSFGEVAATHVSGIIDIETVASIIAARGQIPLKSTRRGAMATIGLTVPQLEPLLPGNDTVVIAAYNGPIAQTISGMEDAVVEVLAKVAEAYPDATARRMTMDFGWHSAHLEDCKDWFLKELGPVSWKDGRLPIISTVTGTFQTRFDADYWWENLRQPVSFTKALDFALDYGIDAYLEVGPHRTLTPLVRGIAQERSADVVAVNSLDRTADDYFTLARAEGGLHVAGVDFERPKAPAGQVIVPKLPWNNQHLLNTSEETKSYLYEAARHPLLGWRDVTAAPSWTNEVTLRGFKFLTDHRVSGDCLFPAVGYIEVMGAALRDHFGSDSVELRDFKLYEALSISEDDIILMTTTFEPVSGRLRIATLHRGSDDGWRTRAEAYGFSHRYELAPAPADLLDPRESMVDKAEFYRLAERHGLEYGPFFQSLTTLHIAEDRLVARLSTRDPHVSKPYFAFPGVLDAVLQAGIGLASSRDGVWTPGVPLPPENEDKAQYQLRLPIGSRKILLGAPLTDEVIVDIQQGLEPDTLKFSVFAPDGRPLVTIDNLQTRALGKMKGRGRQAAGTGSSVFEETFERQEPKPAEALRVPHWLVVGDGTQRLEATLAELVGRGATAEIAPAAPFLALDADEAGDQIRAFMSRSGGKGGVLFSAAFDSGLDEADDGDRLLAGITPIVNQLVTLGKVIDRMTAASEPRPEIVVITSGSRRIERDGPMGLPGLAESALIGVARTMGNEFKGLSIRLVDTDEAALQSGMTVADAMLEDTAETEFVLRGAQRYVPRLEQLSLQEVAPSTRTLDTSRDKSNFSVTMTSPGTIDNIVLREVAEPELLPNEVMVEVAAVGLNFRDIMAATSILPDELEDEGAFWRNLGLEFAGTVRKLGSAVTNLKPGDRIMGMGKGYLRRFAKIRADLAMRVPDSVDLVDAATIPTAFLTAHYSLNHVGRLAQDETALIHLASGGVGLAAIQVARDAGAKVFGTAGSDTKRSYLTAAGVDAVMNSRALDFADQVRALTGGRGVDVVLNSLSGSGIDKSLECLAPFGRMVEIGKRDLADDKPIGLRSLYRNNAYSVIDLSTLPYEKEPLYKRLLGEVEAKVAAGVYKPLEATRFPASRAAEAMRMLSRALHIGKVIVTFDEPTVDIELNLAAPFAASANASYLVTGGLKGFGVAIAEWLSQSGAGTLILANRSGAPDAEAAAAIAIMEARGTKIVPAALDVGDAAAVDRLIATYADGDAPLRGIVHGAAVIEDAFISQLDAGKIDRVLRPKIAGGWNLHTALVKHGVALDFFVNFSSIAQVIGSSGQANYTAANSVLNAIATYRRGRGMAGSSTGWGMIAGSGFVSRSEAMTNYLDSVGIKPVQDSEAAASLAYLLRAKSENMGFANIDWAAIARTNPGAATNPRISPLLGERSGGRSRIQAELAAAPREAWDDLLADMIRREVAKVLKVDASALADDRKLSELGLDSLSSFELKNRVEAQVEVDIPVAKFLQAPTIAGLSRLVASAFEAKLKASAQQLAASQEVTEGGVQQEAFRPLGRQAQALLLDARPMSSPVAKEDNQILAETVIGADVSLATLAERLALLVATHDALRMAGAVTEAGGAEIAFDAQPVLEVLLPGGRLDAVALPGPLWRFGAGRRPDGGLDLQVRAHRAAADAVSVHHVLARLADGSLDEAPSSFADYARQINPAPTSQEHRRDAAYWKEILHHAPPMARIPGRRRAAAPVGIGSNRGPVGSLDIRLPAGSLAGASTSSLLAAYARALASLYGLSALVIDRWYSERGQAVGPIGPLDGSYPVVLPAIDQLGPDLARQVERADDNGFAHRFLDTASLELAFENDLRGRQVSLRQFGFAAIGEAQVAALSVLGDPLAALSPAMNEIQLAVVVGGSAPAVRLSVDLDVVDEATARRLLDDVLDRMSIGSKARASLFQGATQWNVRDASGERRPETAAAAEPSLLQGMPNVEREIPVTSTQLGLLRFHDHPAGNRHTKGCFTVSKEFRIRPQMDADRLRRAIETVMGRHEMMRTRFFRKPDGYGAYIEKTPTEFFRVEHVADEAAAMVRATELAQEIIEIDAPMFRITIIRYGAESDLIVAKGHHLVIDGYSLGLIVEETVKAYLGLPLDPVEMTIDRFIREHDHVGKPGSFERRDEFLRGLFTDPPPVPNIGRKAKGLIPNVIAVDATLSGHTMGSLSREQQDELRRRARAVGTTETAMVAAAFAQMIGARGGVDEIVLQLPAALRHDRRMENYVNFVASDVPVRVSLSRQDTLESMALSISQGIAESLPFAPFMDSNYFGAVHDEVVAKGSYTCLYVVGNRTVDRWTQATQSAPLQRANATGELDLGMFKVTPLPDMRDERPNANELDFRTYPIADGLGFTLTFDTLGYDQNEADDIMRDVVARLLAGQSAVKDKAEQAEA